MSNWLTPSSRSGKIVACGLVVALAGCASVTIKKVPTPSQYVQWTDEMQQQADGMEGLRFYLPRPFVNVFESFPVRTDIYLANGMVSPDGKYVIVTSVTSESGLSDYIANDPRQVKVPSGLIYDPAARKDAIEAQSATLGTVLAGAAALNQLRELVPTGVVGQKKPPPTPPEPPAQAAAQPATGRNRRSVRNDNGAFAYQPLRGNFDIVYLPDFEEQYVISSAAGLGDAMFQVNLGQGWSLQGFDSLVDNSELNRRIFDLIDNAMRLAKGAVTAATGIPLLDLAPAADPGIVPQSAEDQLNELPGTAVTLKIVVVHYAAKGLYPVIKPRELQERVLGSKNTYGFLDLFKVFPNVHVTTEYDATALSRAQRAIEDQTGSFTVPRYPYQYVSFNVFRYMAIEVVRPTDEEYTPFEHLYDKTGTTGDVGDARTGEITETMREVIEVLRSIEGKEQEEEKKVDEIDIQEKVNGIALNARRIINKQEGFTISKLELTVDGKTVKPVGTVSEGDPNNEEFKSTVKTVIEAQIAKSVQLKGQGLIVALPELTLKTE